MIEVTSFAYESENITSIIEEKNQEPATTPSEIKLNCLNCRNEYLLNFSANNINNFNSQDNFISDCPKCFEKQHFIQCPQCEKFTNHKQSEHSNKGTCQHCKKFYGLYICPRDQCRKVIVSNIFNEGYLVTCKDPECGHEFSQVSCSKCLRKITFNSRLIKRDNEIYTSCKSNTNPSNLSFTMSRFIEGQVIECPYEDCNNIFSCLTCYFCFKPSKHEGNKITNGETMTCLNDKCNKKVAKLFCIYCCRMLWFKEGVYHEGKKVTCAYSDCKKIFAAVKCPKCDRYNCWDQKDPYHFGQPTICIYKNCNYEFSKTDCCHCGKRTDYKETKFKFGVNNKCECLGEFTHNVCVCNNSMFIKVHYSEAQGIKCLNSECKRDVFNSYCPHCDNLIIMSRIDYRFGMTIVCPWKICKKAFNYLYCRTCGKGVYYKDADYDEGHNIKCKDPVCNQTHQMLNCSVCNKGIQYTYREDLLKTSLKCIYGDCKSEYNISSVNKRIYHPYAFEFNKNGKYVIYVKPEKSEIYEEKEIFKFYDFKSQNNLIENYDNYFGVGKSIQDHKKI